MYFCVLDGNDVLSPKKLENLAYQAFDKVISNDDSGPFVCLRNCADSLIEMLSKVCDGLENGEFERELTEDEFKVIFNIFNK